MATFENRISATISPADKATILAAYQTIRSTLPFLINLMAEDRKKKRKTGTKRQGYVTSVYQGGTTFSSAIPSTFDMAEWDKDESVTSDLKEIWMESHSVTEAMDDTLLQLGFERIKQADIVFDYLKNAARGNAALTDLVDDIATAFEGQGRRIPIPSITVPPSGSRGIVNAVVNTSFINEGETVLKVIMNGTEVLVRPGDITKVLSKEITVTNVSTTTDGTFAVKTK